MFSVRTNGHRSTARAHVQPQAAAARILLRACAAALTAKSGRDKPTCALPRRAVRVAFRTLTNHRPSLMLLRVDCKALWRCGLYAAEALASGSRLQDATSSEVIQHPRWVMGMFDGRGL